MAEDKKNQTQPPLTKLSRAELTKLIEYGTKMYTSFDPNNTNTILSNLTDSPRVPSKDSVAKALTTYTEKTSSDLLQSYSDFIESYDPLMSGVVNYLAGLLSYDMSYVCDNDYMTQKEFESTSYQNDVRRRNRFLDKFNYKEEFYKITKNVLRRGVYYTYLRCANENLRETPLKLNAKNIKYTIQPMPQDICTLDGSINGILVYSADMNYFNNPNVDINLYPDIFKKYFENVYTLNPNDKNPYKPSAPLKKRKGVYSTQVQTSPIDGAWCFKWDTSTMAITPYLSNLIMGSLDNDTIHKLQTDKNMISAYGLLVGDIPLNTKSKGAIQSDPFTINLETAIDLMYLVKQGLDKNIQSVMMPTEGTKFHQYQDYNEQMSNNSNKEFAGKAVSASGLLYSSEKSNQTEIQAQIMNDYTLISNLYRQYEQFLMYHINRKMSKYTWKISMNGSTQSFIREQHKKNILETSALGLVPNLSMWSTIVGVEPQDYERSLREAKYGGLGDVLTSLQSVHTATANDRGAPQKDESDLADGGEVARDY